MEIIKQLTGFQYLYGPVNSWRMGMSLGIDPISCLEKICNMDCIYCQLGRTTSWVLDRREFILTKEFLREVRTLPPLKLDYLTFSGRGEPTLARNLGAMIEGLRKIRSEKIAVITNSTLLYRPDVQNDLLSADMVVAKLDANDNNTLEIINKSPSIGIEGVIGGILAFKERFHGKLALQMMFTQHNKKHVAAMVQLARQINADEVQLNTPLRASPIKPLSRETMQSIKTYFEGLPVVCVYDGAREFVDDVSNRETLRRHGAVRRDLPEG